MSGSNVGAKALCAVVDTAGTALPCLATNNLDGTATLKADVSVAVDNIDIGNVDITEFPAGNLGQQASAASLSVTPATNIALGTYIGNVGSTSFKVLQSFTRPADTPGAYTTLDAISNSTSAPAIMSQDLASFGASYSRFLVITNARVISSLKTGGLSVNIWIMPATFTATNDHAEFSIDDTTAALGGIVIPCGNYYNTALNSRAVSDPGYWKMQLGAASTTIYFALQVVSGYVPTSGEVFTVVMEGHFE
jgi:hypothetical protein